MTGTGPPPGASRRASSAGSGSVGERVVPVRGGVEAVGLDDEQVVASLTVLDRTRVTHPGHERHRIGVARCRVRRRSVTRTCTSLPTKIFAFASTVARSDATVDDAVVDTDRVSTPATTNTEVSAAPDRSRRAASQVAPAPDPPADVAHRSARRARRAHEDAGPDATIKGST